jgi:hypothetical protein
LTAQIEGELDDIIGDVADKLAAELGIKQWYSMHVLDFCEGTYAPNATAKGAHKNGSICSNKTAMCKFPFCCQFNDKLWIKANLVVTKQIISTQPQFWTTNSSSENSTST